MNKFTLFLFVISLFTLGAKAQDPPAPVLIGDLYYTLDETALTAETAALPMEGETQPRYTFASLIIPTTVTHEGKTYNVVKIGNGSLRELPNLTSVTLPTSVTTIGNSAFAQCPNLMTVSGSANASVIEDWAFYGCAKLILFMLSPNITAISAHCFQNCASLGAMNIPEGVTEIQDCAFQDCSSLTNVSVPSTVNAIKAWSFYGTAIRSITIPEGVVRLVGWTFGNCTALETLKLPASLIDMENWVFDNVSTLKEIYVSWSTAPDPNNPEAAITGVRWWTFGDKVNRSACVVKVPEQYRDAYGATWFDFPVQAYTGMKPISTEQVRVNYANGKLNLFNLDGYTVNIYSVAGQLLSAFKADKTSVQLPLAPGVYVLKATKGQAYASAKFIAK
jgi:hypothetical protein